MEKSETRVSETTPEAPKLDEWAVKRAQMRRWSPAETRSQLEIVDREMILGHNDRVTMRVLQAAGHPVGLARTQKLAARVKETWARESAAKREINRAAAEKRVMAQLEVAREEALGEKDVTGKWIREPNWEAHRVSQRWEAHLADLQGTREPIKVNIDLRVSEACTNVIAGLSPERTAQLLAMYRENQALAARYRAMTAPVLPPVQNGRAP